LASALQVGRSSRFTGWRASALAALLPTLALASVALASGLEDFDDQQDLDRLTRLDPVATLLGGGAYVAWSFPSRGGDDHSYRIRADASTSGGVAGPSRAMGVFVGFGAQDFAASVELLDWSQSSGDVSIGIAALRDLGPGATDGYALVVRPSVASLEMVRLDGEQITPLATTGIALDASQTPAQQLASIQALLAQGDARARKVFETIGTYAGYGIAHYADFYDFGHMLLLGRVTTGQGGDIVIAKAREVLNREFRELAGKITLHVPDEKSRRVGQAVAAASLPEVKRARH